MQSPHKPRSLSLSHRVNVSISSARSDHDKNIKRFSGRASLSFPPNSWLFPLFACGQLVAGPQTSVKLHKNRVAVQEGRKQEKEESGRERERGTKGNQTCGL